MVMVKQFIADVLLPVTGWLHLPIPHFLMAWWKRGEIGRKLPPEAEQLIQDYLRKHDKAL